MIALTGAQKKKPPSACASGGKVTTVETVYNTLENR